jgi:hypothetical protein
MPASYRKLFASDFFIHTRRNGLTITSHSTGASGMDWQAAIDINREALKRVLAALVAMAGFAETFSLRDEPVRGIIRATLPRHLHRAVLRLLRPAEAAARRLIIVAARDIAVAPAPPRACKAKGGLPLVRNGVGTGIVLPRGVARLGTCLPAARLATMPRAPSFALFDPLRPAFRRRRPKPSGVPRIWALGGRDPVPIPVRKPPLPGDPVDAARLDLRLAALASALDDLPKQARRFALWRARNADRRKRGSRLRRLSPLRSGPPPGSLPRASRQPPHEVNEILDRAHGLAFFVLEHPDTS